MNSDFVGQLELNSFHAVYEIPHVEYWPLWSEEWSNAFPSSLIS